VKLAVVLVEQRWRRERPQIVRSARRKQTGDLLGGCLGSLKSSLSIAVDLEARLARKLKLFAYPLGAMDSATVGQ